MTPREIASNVAAYGEAHQNPELVAKYSRYFKEGYDAYGLTHEQVQARVDEILSLPGMSLPNILETTHLLVPSPKYEMTAIAIQLVKSLYRQWDTTVFPAIEAWFSEGITNWAHTDYICGELMNLLFRKKLVSTDSLAHWRTASNRFQRRAAVVSLIKPMKLSTDFSPWFAFIEPMMRDPAREVHQGLGWFLRETWKKQPGPTEVFLHKYKDTAPRLIFQYATEKMTKEGRERFRKNRQS